MNDLSIEATHPPSGRTALRMTLETKPTSAPHITRVMVAEDDVDMAYVLEFLLSREGFQVDLVGDGRDAVLCIESEPAPDVVLLDVMMSFVSGFQVLRAVRDHPGWRSVPVVMVSGKGSEQDVVNALSAGADDYLTKPFRPRELVARVRGQVARAASAKARVA